MLKIMSPIKRPRSIVESLPYYRLAVVSVYNIKARDIEWSNYTSQHNILGIGEL